jgi:hypothetical protein
MDIELRLRLIELERKLKESEKKLKKLGELSIKDKVMIEMIQQNLKESNLLLERKRKKNEIFKSLCNSVKQFIQTQPKSFKKQFYKYIITNSNSPSSFFIDQFQIPKSTYYRYASAVPTISKQRNDSPRYHEMNDIIDSILPVTSGRDYRILSTTKNYVFNEYTKLSTSPMSKSTVFTYLQHLSIRRIKYTFCPMCALENRGAVEIHKSQAQHQRLCYINDRNLGENTEMFILDFSKVEGRQVLIISSVAPTSITWKHYVAPNPDTSNDSKFVINVLNDIKLKNGTKKVIIWSDGGRKHFKNSTTLQYLQLFKNKKSIEITWNFFISYHGYNPCDLGASHIKSKLRVNQEETGKDQSSINSILAAGNVMDSHEATIAQLYNVEYETRKKMVNISKYHQFIIAEDYIEAFILHPIRPIPQFSTTVTKKGVKELAFNKIYFCR